MRACVAAHARKAVLEHPAGEVNCGGADCSNLVWVAEVPAHDLIALNPYPSSHGHARPKAPTAQLVCIRPHDSGSVCWTVVTPTSAERETRSRCPAGSAG